MRRKRKSNPAHTARHKRRRNEDGAYMHDVVIVGGGPAGLAAASELKRLGVRDVVVIEREQHAGGVPRHCGHTGFGWREFRRMLTGPSYAHRLVSTAAGVTIRTGTTALQLQDDASVVAVSAKQQEVIQGRHVLLALGTRETPRAARLVSGPRPFGVFTTGSLQQLVYLANLKPCQRAVIVGTELVSFSSLLTMRHAGIKSLAMLESAARVQAPALGRWVARFGFNTKVMTHTEVVAIHGAQFVTGVEVERNGQRRKIECDGIVFSGQFVPETAIVKTSHLTIDPGTGGPAVDQYGRCSNPRFFAAGNVLRPVEASWTAWSEGQAVARAIAASLHGSLPPARHTVSVKAEGDARYVCPQVLSLPAPLPPALPFHLRADVNVKAADVAIVRGEKTLWSNRARLKPQRRIVVPLAPELASAAQSLSVRIQLTRGFKKR